MIRFVYAYLLFPENDNFCNRLKNNSYTFFPWTSFFIPNHCLTSILFCHAYFITEMESELAGIFQNCVCCQVLWFNSCVYKLTQLCFTTAFWQWDKSFTCRKIVAASAQGIKWESDSLSSFMLILQDRQWFHFHMWVAFVCMRVNCVCVCMAYMWYTRVYQQACIVLYVQIFICMCIHVCYMWDMHTYTQMYACVCACMCIHVEARDQS